MFYEEQREKKGAAIRENEEEEANAAATEAEPLLRLHKKVQMLIKMNQMIFLPRQYITQMKSQWKLVKKKKPVK